MSLGRRLKHAREQRGLSQRALARVAQVDHTWISRVEEELRQNISFAAAKRLAVALGVTLDYLGEIDGQPRAPSRRGRPPKRRPADADEDPVPRPVGAGAHAASQGRLMPAADDDGLDFGMLSDRDLEQMLHQALSRRETGLVHAVRRERARRLTAPPSSRPARAPRLAYGAGADGSRGQAPLTPEAFAAQMRHLATSTDWEGAHEAADALMGQILTALGYGEGVAVFQAMPKWYA